MTYEPYVLLSDIHFHGWSQFSSLDEYGVNSRLQGLVGEVERAADELKKAGGKVMVLAGDIFHTRGSVEPVVLNTVMDLFRDLRDAGIVVRAIPGNHDLSTKDTVRVHNAAAALEECGVYMVHKQEGRGWAVAESHAPMVLMPWHEDLNLLRKNITEIDPTHRATLDLIIHAPVNDVIKGIPDHGLEPEWLSSLGFRNVFAGHYHNHKQVAPHVYSIGALAHHTWSDVGSKAGFLLVGDEVRWMKSHLPEFIDLQRDTPEDEMAMLVDQNYVRAKVGEVSSKEENALRKMLADMGAKGVIIQSVKEPTKIRAEKVVKSGEPLLASVSSFVSTLEVNAEMMKAVNQSCVEVMAEAGAA